MGPAGPPADVADAGREEVTDEAQLLIAGITDSVQIVVSLIWVREGVVVDRIFYSVAV